MVEQITLLITAASVVFGAYTYYRDSKRKTKQDTLEAYTDLQRSTLSKINLWMPSEIKEATEDKKSDGYKELSSYLAEIERFCVGINEGIYDFDTFYKLSHGYFDSEIGLLKPRLLPLLEAKSDNAKEDYFANLHKVWERMEKWKTQ
jgi:hypothetical protein